MQRRQVLKGNGHSETSDLDLSLAPMLLLIEWAPGMCEVYMAIKWMWKQRTTLYKAFPVFPQTKVQKQTKTRAMCWVGPGSLNRILVLIVLPHVSTRSLFLYWAIISFQHTHHSSVRTRAGRPQSSSVVCVRCPSHCLCLKSIGFCQQQGSWFLSFFLLYCCIVGTRFTLIQMFTHLLAWTHLSSPPVSHLC